MYFILCVGYYLLKNLEWIVRTASFFCFWSIKREMFVFDVFWEIIFILIFLELRVWNDCFMILLFFFMLLMREMMECLLFIVTCAMFSFLKFCTSFFSFFLVKFWFYNLDGLSVSDMFIFDVVMMLIEILLDVMMLKILVKKLYWSSMRVDVMSSMVTFFFCTMDVRS